LVNYEITETVAASHSDVPTHDVTANTFSFALQNVSAAILHGLLPQPTFIVLELAIVVAHDDAHSLGVEQTHSDDQDMSVPTSPAAVAPVPSIVEHVDVHEDIVLATEVSNSSVQHIVASTRGSTLCLFCAS
jgi:hypothetical protein